MVGNIDNLKPNKKGERLGGRKAGTPNKNTQILKEALLDAASVVGFPEEITLIGDDGKPTGVIKLKKTGKDGMQGYLEWLSMNSPRSFAALLVEQNHGFVVKTVGDAARDPGRCSKFQFRPWAEARVRRPLC